MYLLRQNYMIVLQKKNYMILIIVFDFWPAARALIESLMICLPNSHYTEYLNFSVE